MSPVAQHIPNPFTQFNVTEPVHVRPDRIYGRIQIPEPQQEDAADVEEVPDSSDRTDSDG